jgi:hypothetical protein
MWFRYALLAICFTLFSAAKAGRKPLPCVTDKTHAVTLAGKHHNPVSYFNAAKTRVSYYHKRKIKLKGLKVSLGAIFRVAITLQTNSSEAPFYNSLSISLVSDYFQLLRGPPVV